MKYQKIITVLIILVLISVCKKEESKTVLCLGDSITESHWGNYPVFLDKMLRKGSTRIRAISLGRPGNTSGEYLKYFKTAGVLKKYDPEIIILMLGTNDVRVDYDNTPTPQYKKNMLEIVDIIRNFEEKEGKKVKIYIASIPPIFTPDLHTFTEVSAKRIEDEIIPAIRDIASERKLKIIDIHGMFLENRELLPGIHPTPGGYYKIAREIYKAITNIR
ncbi:MAG: SGNH/GDSL hydrolase family protein [Acidobacteriota bacterium]